MKIFKFGGASVKDAESVRNLGNVLQQYGGNELLVVVSAMGKTTNALEQLARAFYENSSEKNRIYSEIKSFHDEIISGLLKTKTSHTYDDIENLFIELDCELETKAENDFDKVYDQIVSYGEIFSSRIVSAFLNEYGISNRWMDCRNFIVTDNTYREGKIDWDNTSNLIQKKLGPIVKKQLVVTQGFIGRNKETFNVTLGREGSDYSAAIFAYGLDAESVTIWKDVDGVMSADPKKFDDAIMLNALSYSRAIEMAYYGASVIHPKTIQPLKSKNIPLYVKSFIHPENEGTKVGVDKNHEDHLPMYISKGDQMLLSIMSKDFNFIVEDKLSKIFSIFAGLKVKVNMMQNSAISFSVCIENNTDKSDKLIEELSKEFEVKSNKNLELLTISNYNEDMIQKLLGQKTILLEQKTRNTCQFVLKP